MQLISPLPFEEATQKFGARSPIASLFNSEEWSKNVPIGLRERAFFSAQVESVRFLQRGKNALDSFLTGARDPNHGGLKVGSRADFVRQMQEFALAEGMGPLDPKDKGTIKDITSRHRLELIFDVQTKQAHDYGAWRQGQDPDVLDEFPAQRFIRVRAVQVERPYHKSALGDVRLKNDLRYWVTLNRDFGTPWGPWGFNSGCDVEDVDRDEAEQLGLLQPGQRVEPAEVGMNDYLEASTKGLDAKTLSLLDTIFGTQIEITGDSVRWKAAAPTPPAPPTVPATRSRPPTPAPVAASPNAPPTSPAVANVPDLLRELGLDTAAAADRATPDQMTRLLAELREAAPVNLASIIDQPTLAVVPSAQAKVRDIERWAQEFLDFLPPALARSLPPLRLEVHGSTSSVGGKGSHQRLPKHSKIRIATTMPMRVAKRARTRAQVVDVDIPDEEVRSTVWHELMHWVHLSGPQAFRDVIDAHWDARTKGEPVIMLPHYGVKGKRDKWYEEYAGRIYDGNTERGTEVPTRYVQLLAMPPKELALHWRDPVVRETLELMLQAFFPTP